jgi:hypothetical protein
MSPFAISLLAATVIFTVLFVLQLHYRQDALRIGTDLGGFGGSFGGWEFSVSLAYLLAAIGFGICFTLAMKSDQAQADQAKRLTLVEIRAQNGIRVLKNSQRAIEHAVKAAGIAAKAAADAASSAAKKADEAARAAHQAGDNSLRAVEAAQAVKVVCPRKPAAAPLPIAMDAGRPCHCAEGDAHSAR